MGKTKKKSKQKTTRNSLILFVVPTIFYFSTTFLLVVGFILVGLGGIRSEDTLLLLVPLVLSIVSVVLIKSTKTPLKEVFIGWFRLNFPSLFS